MYRQRRNIRQPIEDDEHEQRDRWLVSYADYMTLMFALFVVLYSIAIVKEDEYQVLSETLGKVFETKASEGQGVLGEGILLHNDPVDTEFQLYGTSIAQERGPELLDGRNEVSNVTEKKRGHPLSGLQEDLKDALFDLTENGVAEVRLDDDWLTIELNSGLLFASGSASPTKSAELVLKEINTIIGPVDNFIRVRGYTDNQPINTEFYASNWELSVARATVALRMLESLNIDSRRMAIEGYGQHSPFTQNDTAQGRSSNRKVVIALSKYALDVSKKAIETDRDSKTLAPSQQTKQPNGDHEQVQVIELPSGGIRITTRRDKNGDTKKDKEDNK